jgi:hypothetical protein
MHGGAPGSGGPTGTRNGNYKHGLYTAEAIGSRRSLRQQIREVRALTTLKAINPIPPVLFRLALHPRRRRMLEP